MIERFKNIFEGLDRAHGVTLVGESNGDGNKIKGKSFVKREPVTDDLWQKHLDGKDSLGVIPINDDNKCKWGCIDIDSYAGFDHKKLINKIKQFNLPLIVCRSKSGGAHVFLFTDKFVPAALFRNKLKDMAAKLGYANAEIFPKQNKVDMNKGGTGSFLNLPYHNALLSVRYGIKDDGSAMDLYQFFEAHDKVKLTEDQLSKLSIQEEKVVDNLLKGAPPCLVTIAKQGIPNGQRNNALYNFGVYCKKRFPDTWDRELFKYNDAYCEPPLDKKEVDTLIKSIDGKEYNYKCKDEPIASYCNSKKCVMQEYGVGDGVPETEIKEIQKYDSDPPLYYVTIGDEQVEVESQDLHEPDRFSLKCLEQINQAMPPVGKLIWRKAINKLLKNTIPIEAPESTKVDVQLRELLVDYTMKIPGKEWADILRGLSFTEDEVSYFKYKDFWKYIVRTKLWDTKKYTKAKTARMLETLFGAEEIPGKINNKSVRYIAVKQQEVNKPIVRKTKMKEPPFA